MLKNAQERPACWGDWLGRLKANGGRVVVVASDCVVGLGRKKINLLGL